MICLPALSLLAAALPSAIGDSSVGFGSSLVVVERENSFPRLVIFDSTGDLESRAKGSLHIVDPRSGEVIDRWCPGLTPLSLERSATGARAWAKGDSDLAFLATDNATNDRTPLLVLLNITTGKESARVKLSRVGADTWVELSSLGQGKERGTQEFLVTYTAKREDGIAAAEEAPSETGIVTEILSMPSGKLNRSFECRRAVSVGDVDSDGLCDLVLSRGRVHGVFSSATGKLLFELKTSDSETLGLNGGVEHFPGPDGDGDGVGDITEIVHREYAKGMHIVPRLLSGRTGNELWSTSAVECSDLVKVNTCCIQDRNDDGILELVVTTAALSLGSCPGWRILSGADGATIEHHDWSAVPETDLDPRVRAHSLVGLPSVEIRGKPMKSVLALSHQVRNTSHPEEVFLLSAQGALVHRIKRL